MSDPDITITNITAGDIAEFRTLLGKLGDGDITAIRVLVGGGVAMGVTALIGALIGTVA